MKHIPSRYIERVYYNPSAYSGLAVLTLVGASHQSGNLQEWKNSALTTLAYINTTGGFFGAQVIATGNISGANILTAGLVDGVDVSTLGSTFTTHTGSSSAHNTTSAIVGISDTQVLTNKTITGLSNIVAATHLQAGAALVTVSGSAAPSSGYVLIASSSSNAAWQAPTVYSYTGWTRITDGTNTATGHTTGDTFKFRTANNILTVTVSDNDVTHGDNALFTIVQSNINHQLISGSGVVTHAQLDTHVTSTTGHGTTSAVVGISDSQTLTNKILTGLTNTVGATHLHATSGLVSISGAAAPSTGQVLTAISATSASWQTLPVDRLFTGWSIITDGTNRLTGSTTGDTIKFRSASTMLTVGVSDNDVTHGDNVLYTVNPSNIPHTGLSGVGVYTHTQIDTHITSTTGHGTTSAVVGINDTQTLTNKTITGLTNIVSATHLQIQSGLVSISGAALPSTGQVLTAVSSSLATWQSLPADRFFTGWSIITDGTNRLTGSATGDTIKFRTSNSMLSASVVDNDGTHGDYVLYNINLPQIPHTGLSGVGTYTHAQIDTHITSTTGHGTSSAVVGISDTQTLSNKTITGLSNIIYATHLHAGLTGISISGATPPTSGQALVAISATSAIWQTVSGGGSSSTFTGWGRIIDSSNNQITGSTTGDWLKFRSASAALTIAAKDADATHGDNLLFTIVPSQISHANLANLTADDHSLYVVGDASRTSSHVSLGNDPGENFVTLLITQGVDQASANLIEVYRNDFQPLFTLDNANGIGAFLGQCTQNNGVAILDQSNVSTVFNKTLTGLSNNISASRLQAGAAMVVVSGAAAPSSGQVLMATSSTAATWQAVSISGATFNGWSLITDGTNNITGSATGDTLKFRSVTGAITVGAANADPTHGDNIYLNLVPGQIAHATLAGIGTKSHDQIETDLLTISLYILTHEGSTSTHGVVGNIVGTASSQTLTNKTITGLTNIVAATHLHAQAGLVMVSGSAAPTSGQVLTAVSSTEATWQAGGGPGGGISFATAFMLSQLAL